MSERLESGRIRILKTGFKLKNFLGKAGIIFCFVGHVPMADECRAPLIGSTYCEGGNGGTGAVLKLP